jgi:hypothetical protein
VTDASLTLTTGEFSGGGTSDAVAHRILAANASFSDAGFAVAASTGETSWNYRVHDTARWAGDSGSDGGTDAGCSVSGTDFDADVMFSGTLSNTHTTANTLTDPDATARAEVEAMIANNYGMVVRTTTDTVRYLYSSESGTAAYRPQLVIVYTEAASGNPWHAYAQQ